MLRRNKASGAACLLVAVLWLLSASATLAQVEHGGPAIAPPASTATPAPVVTPTPDRLAAPPTVPSPNQADEGAQLYWLHCQPCHGDRGQGLTDEWRAQYPPEDSNCWESGCHGNRPYDQGFILPTAVPAVIGDTVLQKFQTMDEVYRYVSVAMPYFFPGDLTQAEYLAIVAHLARENGLWDGQTLTPDNLLDYPLPGGAVATAQPTPTTAAPAAPAARPAIDAGRIGLIALVALIAVGGIFLWRNRIR